MKNRQQNNNLNSTKKYITYKHLERLLTCQKYFIWNSEIENQVNQINQNDEEENAFWEIFSDFDLEELEDYKFVEIIKKGFDHVKKLFLDYIYFLAKKNQKNIEIIEEKNNNSAFEKTMKLLKDQNVDWIVNPIFIYEDLISKPILYMKDKKYLFSLIHGSKTKLKNYLKSYFDYNVCQKLNIQVNEYLFFTYDNKKDYENSNDLSFVFSPYCWTQKNGPQNNQQNIEEHCNHQTIVTKLKSGLILEKDRGRQSDLFLFLENFDSYIEQIKEAKSITKIPNEISYEDMGPWGENPHFNSLFDYEKHKLKPVSGNLLNKKELLQLEFHEKTIWDFATQKKSLYYVINNIHKYDLKKIKNYINKIQDKNIVWYDFEGFSMPYTIIPHTKSYQQLIFQVSTIRTINEKKVYTNNIVLDPQQIKVEDFFNIIDEIYWEKADYYVVYNQTYEINKLNDMIKLFELFKINKEKIVEYGKKVLEIENKTLDLLDLFKISTSKEKIPSIFIPDLLGFSSIKKLEKYITENNFKFDIMITPYKELKVQNGLMAMNKAIQRYLKTIGEKEWEKTAQELKLYCENDVNAMIMVYFFIKDLYYKETKQEKK